MDGDGLGREPCIRNSCHEALDGKLNYAATQAGHTPGESTTIRLVFRHAALSENILQSLV